MRVKPPTLLVLTVAFAFCGSTRAQLPDRRDTVGDDSPTETIEQAERAVIQVNTKPTDSLGTVLKPSPTSAFTPAHRVWGRSFWAPWGILAGLAVADNELSAACVHHPNCVESNPIFGPHPTRLELYGVKGAFLGTAFYLSQKRKREGKWDWTIPLIVGIPVYGAIVTLNAIHIEQHRSSP